MLAEKFTINCPAGTGNFQKTLSITPKVVLFWGTNQTAEGIADDQAHFFGAATSSTQRWACSSFCDDNVGTVDVGRVRSSAACIFQLGSSTAAAVVADFVSMDTNAFTVNFTTVTSGVIIHGLALGGSSLTNVKAGLIEIAVATGDQDFTDPGFQPDCVLLARAGRSGTLWDGVITAAEDGFSLAAGLSSSARWMITLSIRDLATMASNVDAMSTQRTDSIYLGLNPTGPALEGLGDYSGGIANGFRLNISDAPIGATVAGYVAFKGDSYAVGAFSAPTSNGGTNDVNVGFTPEAVLFSTWGNASSTTITADAVVNIGAATYNGTEGMISTTTDDDVLNTQADSRTVTTKAIGSLIEGATATVDSEADSDLTGVGGANTFRLTWPDAPAVANEICYVAFGPHESASTPAPLFPYAQQYMRTGR